MVTQLQKLQNNWSYRGTEVTQLQKLHAYRSFKASDVTQEQKLYKKYALLGRFTQGMSCSPNTVVLKLEQNEVIYQFAYNKQLSVSSWEQYFIFESAVKGIL